MDCLEVAQLLSEGPLHHWDAERRAAIARHLQDCERCRGRWKQEKDTQWFCGVFSSLRARGSVREAVMARLDETVAGR